MIYKITETTEYRAARMEDTDLKWCPKCAEQKPLDAYRRDKSRADGVDGVCKRCRRMWAKANRKTENARTSAYRRKQWAEGVRDPLDAQRAKARVYARRAHPEQKKCVIRGCQEKGERHHHEGYDNAHMTDIMFLCRKHHQEAHIMERARRRLAPAWY